MLAKKVWWAPCLPDTTAMDIRRAFRDHQEAFSAAAESLPDVLEQFRATLQGCLEAGGLVLSCGNGGSAADAQHLASELVGRVRQDRRPLRAVALTTDTSALTAISNDYGFDAVFARQVNALARPGDVLVAISTSGSSANVIQAAKAARAIGCSVVALTGRSGGALAQESDLLVPVPADIVTRIQELHEFCIHAVCDALEQDLIDSGASG